MADLSDVETAIANLIGSVVYPNGSASPSSLLGGSGSPVGVKIYRGWPNPAQLDKDLAAGLVNISVFPRVSVDRNTTRYPVDFQEISRGVATLTATVSDNKVTIGGTVNVAVAQFVTIIIGPRVVVSYAVQVGDTLVSIAASLAALITAAFAPTTSAGPVISVPTSAYLVAEVGVTGIQMAETERQLSQLQITFWCPDPVSRDNAGKLIRPVLSQRTFITLADQSAARFRFHGTNVSDSAERVQLYRRDTIYDVEFATTVTDAVFEVTSININSKSGQSALGVSPAPPQTNSNYPVAPGQAPLSP